MKLTLKMDIINKPYYQIYYHIIMAALAMFVIISLFMQNKLELSFDRLQLLQRVDFAVWIIFVSDYFIRFFLSQNKLHFVRNNVIDFLSILPFDMVFQGLRAARILRIVHMLRVFIYLTRLQKRLTAIIKTNNFHHVLWFTFSTIFCGAISISYIDDMDIGDALWWSFVTTTTVGYGDIAPQSLGGRLVAVVLMLIGIGFLSTLTGTISTFFISSNNKKTEYVDDVIEQIINKLADFSSLDLKDIHDINAVLVVLKERQTKERNDINGIY